MVRKREQSAKKAFYSLPLLTYSPSERPTFITTVLKTDTDKRFLMIAICRSEEHTSELQSQSNLVCRLLLEKKEDTLSAVYERRASRPRVQPATQHDVSQRTAARDIFPLSDARYRNISPQSVWRHIHVEGF